MIIYGTGSKVLKEATLENVKCSNCDHNRSIVTIIQKYFDLFWIPTFPIGKSIFLTCENCQNVRIEKQFPDEFKQTSKQLKSSVSTPFYTFSGLFLILMIIGYFSYDRYQADQIVDDYLHSPQKGDVYALYDENEPTEYKYYFFKVTGVEGDSIFFTANDYGYDGMTQKLDPKDGFYNTIEYAIHKEEVYELQNSGELKTIYRDYDEASGFNRTIDIEFDSLDREELMEEEGLLEEDSLSF